jgi:hypothetical protein
MAWLVRSPRCTCTSNRYDSTNCSLERSLLTGQVMSPSDHFVDAHAVVVVQGAGAHVGVVVRDGGR